MYNYIKTDNPPLEELKEVGMDLVIEIAEMMPDQTEESINLIRGGLPNNDYSAIARGAHSIKSNLKLFMDEHSPAVEFSYDFETRATELKEELKENGIVENDFDFTPDLEKLIEITKKPLEEIKRLGEEYKNGLRP